MVENINLYNLAKRVVLYERCGGKAPGRVSELCFGGAGVKPLLGSTNTVRLGSVALGSVKLGQVRLG